MSLRQALVAVDEFAHVSGRRLRGVATWALMSGGWSAAVPIAIAQVFAEMAGPRRIGAVAWSLGWWLALGILSAVAGRYRDRSAASVAAEVGAVLRARLADRHLRAVGERESLEVTAVSGVEAVTTVIARVLPDLTSAAYSMVTGMSLACVLNWRVGLVVVAAAGPVVWLCARMASRARVARTAYADGVKLVVAEARRFFHPAGRELVSTMQARPRVAFRMNRLTRNLAVAEEAMFKVNYWPATQTLGTLLGLSVVVGSYLLHGVPVGLRVAFAMVASQQVASMLSVAIWLQELAAQIPHIEAVKEALELPAERAGGERLASAAGRLEFNAVVARYADGRLGANGLSLHVAPGEAVALIGPSGAGKTTLMKLAIGDGDLRLQAGRVLLDGRLLERLELGQVRRLLIREPQSPWFFDGTVTENMLFPEASEDQIRWACELVLMDEVIRRWPNGYQTIIDGQRLSGGQAQRLGLARTLLHAEYWGARVMLLDEITAALDQETSREVLTRVLEFARSAGMTVLVSSHKLPVHPAFERVVVLEHGRVVEDGDPRELAANPDSVYARLLTATHAGPSAAAT
jgi:ATP-binding cassette subfamily B protein